MKRFEPTLEHAFYALALILAVGLRFLRLDVLPLSNFEADWALQALRVAQGLRPAIGPNPSYVHLTAIPFFLFGAANFLSRLWPALAGTALVLAPWLLRRRFGRIPALVLAFGLALDPGLVAMSRLAGGPILAITFLVLSVLVWLDGHRRTAAVFAGLALLSGPSVWFGLLGLGLTWLFTSVFKGNLPAQAQEVVVQAEAEGETKTMLEETVAASASLPPGSAQTVFPGEVSLPGTTSSRSLSGGQFPPVEPGRSVHWQDYRDVLAWGLGTLLLAGSLALLSPKGLPAFVMSFVESLRGWWMLSGVPLWRPLMALPAYEILPLGFGLAGALRGILKRDTASIRLGIWALAAVVLALIYPGKQTGDITWALLPLWTLAAIELGHHFDFEGCSLWEIAGVVTLVLSLLVFGWLDLVGVTTMDLGSEEVRMRLYLLVAVLVLIGLSLLLVRAGWSEKVARLGGVWAAVLALTSFTLAMSTGAAGVREPLTAELWQPEPRTSRVDVLLKVANQISDLNEGYDSQLPLTVLGVDSPALEWLFRDWPVKVVSALAPDAKPEIVISSIDTLSLAADYRGEPLPLTEVADWDHATPSIWLKWFVYRQMPILRQEVILWVRSDLFLDSQVPSTP